VSSRSVRWHGTPPSLNLGPGRWRSGSYSARGGRITRFTSLVHIEGIAEVRVSRHTEIETQPWSSDQTPRVPGPPSRPTTSGKPLDAPGGPTGDPPRRPARSRRSVCRGFGAPRGRARVSSDRPKKCAGEFSAELLKTPITTSDVRPRRAAGRRHRVSRWAAMAPPPPWHARDERLRLVLPARSAGGRSGACCSRPRFS